MEKIRELYQSLDDSTIIDLYMYSCLIASGFNENEEKVIELLPLLKEIWLKDETDKGISSLSDSLFEAYKNDVKIEKLSPREILILEEFM